MVAKLHSNSCGERRGCREIRCAVCWHWRGCHRRLRCTSAAALTRTCTPCLLSCFLEALTAFWRHPARLYTYSPLGRTMSQTAAAIVRCKVHRHAALALRGGAYASGYYRALSASDMQAVFTAKYRKERAGSGRLLRTMAKPTHTSTPVEIRMQIQQYECKCECAGIATHALGHCR